MNVTKAGIFALALAGSAVLPNAGASARTFVYAVTVTTNFGTQFNDCFSFNAGTLVVGGLPGALVTTAAPLKPKAYYTAVANNALIKGYGVAIAFSGEKIGNDKSGSMEAIGADAGGDSYVVTGPLVTSCSADAPKQGNNWNRNAH